MSQSEQMSLERLAEIKKLAEEASPGPWYWKGNTTGMSPTLYLYTRVRHQIVMRFNRWGMQGAIPWFREWREGSFRSLLSPASNHFRSSSDHNKWDIVEIDHPDARFMAESRQAIDELIAEVERLRAHRGKWED